MRADLHQTQFCPYHLDDVGKSLQISKPQLPYLKKRETNIYIIGLQGFSAGTNSWDLRIRGRHWKGLDVAFFS